MPANLLSPFAGATPFWARDLIIEVCRAARVPLPDYVAWSVCEDEQSHGVTRTTLDPVRVTISITAGTSEDDARHCLLHELAHYLEDGSGPVRRARQAHGIFERATGKKRDPHNRAFFARAGRLFAGHGSYDIADAIKREVLTYHTHRHDLAAGLRDAGLGAHLPAVWGAEAVRARALRSAPTVRYPAHTIVPAARGARFVCATCGTRLDAKTLRAIEHYRPSGRLLSHQIIQRGAGMSD